MRIEGKAKLQIRDWGCSQVSIYQDEIEYTTNDVDFISWLQYFLPKFVGGQYYSNDHILICANTDDNTIVDVISMSWERQPENASGLGKIYRAEYQKNIFLKYVSETDDTSLKFGRLLIYANDPYAPLFEHSNFIFEITDINFINWIKEGNITKRKCGEFVFNYPVSIKSLGYLNQIYKIESAVFKFKDVIAFESDELIRARTEGHQ